MEILQKYLNGYRNGIYTLVETISAIPANVHSENVSEIMTALPAEVLEALRKTVNAAPSSDEEWADCIDIREEWTHARASQRDVANQQYRKGISALRTYFDSLQTATQEAEPPEQFVPRQSLGTSGYSL